MKFQKHLEEFLHKFQSMSNEEFLESVPDIQDEICDLWDEHKKMKEKSGPVIVTVYGGVAGFDRSPEGFVTGVEIRDYDVEKDKGWDELKTDEDGNKYQEILFEFKNAEKGESENS